MRIFRRKQHIKCKIARKGFIDKLFSILSIFVHQFDQKGSYNEDTEKSTSFFSFQRLPEVFPARQTLFSPHFSARPGRFLPGFCVCCQKTASLGFLRQFGSALGAVSLDFLRKIQRVTVFLAIITQITAKNHPVGAAALSGSCPLAGTNLIYLMR